MYFQFCTTNGTTIEEHPTNEEAIKRASEIAKTKGKVNVWVPAFVVVPETKFNVLDYDKC